MSTIFNPNTFIGKKTIKMIGVDSDDKAIWYTQQVKDFNIKTDGETETKEDAYGNTVATLAKSKKCTISFSTPFIDLNLIAAQNGISKTIASDSAKLVCPDIYDYVVKDADITSNVCSIVLPHSVKANSGAYTLMVMRASSDNSIGTNFEMSGTATATTGKFVYTSSTHTVSFAANDVTVNDRFIIKYYYETASAVQLVVSADTFPKAEKVYALVEGCDVCDQSKVLYAYYAFPNATMKNSSDIKIGLSEDISIEMDCAYEYCSNDKEFYTLSMAE